MTDKPVPVSDLPAKWRTMPLGPFNGASHEMGYRSAVRDCADALEAALRALPGDLKWTAKQLWETSNGEPDMDAILAALQSAAIAGWQRCPVTLEPHVWFSSIDAWKDRCTKCHVLRSAVEKPEPAEAGSATGSIVQTAWVDPGALDRTSG